MQGKESFGIVKNLGPVHEAEDNIKGLTNLTEFNNTLYSILSVDEDVKNIRDIYDGVKEYTWEIARLLQSTTDDTVKILKIESCY